MLPALNPERTDGSNHPQDLQTIRGIYDSAQGSQHPKRCSILRLLRGLYAQGSPRAYQRPWTKISQSWWPSNLRKIIPRYLAFFVSGGVLIMAKRSLRAAINAHCRSCIEDKAAPGTWLAQVSLCPCTDCKLYDVRPTTDAIPDSVYEYYGEKRPQKSTEKLKKARNGRISEISPSDETPEVGSL